MTAATERLDITIRVRRRIPLALAAPHVLHAGPRQFLTREAYAAQFAADPDEITQLADFLARQQLDVIDASVARRSLFVSGTRLAISNAIARMPVSIAAVVEGIFGLDERPIAEPHFQRQAPAGMVARDALMSWSPVELAEAYHFPANTDGSGECIALIELGGGYRVADLKLYFTRLQLAPPRLAVVHVDGGANTPTTIESSDGEVMLDIEVAAAMAPGTRIVVYFAPNSERGFLDALTAAVHDTLHRPSIISISWGSAEDRWTSAAKHSFDEALQTAAALGITVCVAAGDKGSDDGVNDGKLHVDFPASSPFALACGGTRLLRTAGAVNESAWNDSPVSATGGGVSEFFPLPAYQHISRVPTLPGTSPYHGRGVPDVCANADPATGYVVRVDGEDVVVGGTSAVAPLWAALVARINQALGRPVGFLNPLLYQLAAGSAALRDVSTGSNGAWRARTGWDPCTGLGAPDGEALLAALRDVLRE